MILLKFPWDKSCTDFTQCHCWILPNTHFSISFAAQNIRRQIVIFCVQNCVLDAQSLPSRSLPVSLGALRACLLVWTVQRPICRYTDTKYQQRYTGTQIHGNTDTHCTNLQIHTRYTLWTHKYKVCSVPICEYTEQKSWVWPYLIQFARKSARIKSRDRFQNIEMHNKAFQNISIHLSHSFRKWMKRDRM